MLEMTKFYKLTVRGKTKKECEQFFEMIHSFPDVQAKEFDKKIGSVRRFDGRKK